MGQVTIVLDDATEAALGDAAHAAGVSCHKWLVDLVRRHAGGDAPPAILIVDDDPVFREVLRCQVEYLGWAAETAENGAEALALLAERRYRLLLTDCRMPVMDGFQLAHAVRARERRNGGPPLPVIAVTAEAIRVDDAIRRELGIDDCLAKPPAAQALARVFARWLGAADGHASRSAVADTSVLAAE